MSRDVADSRVRALEDAIHALADSYGGVEFLLGMRALPLAPPHGAVLRAAVDRSRRRADTQPAAAQESEVTP